MKSSILKDTKWYASSLYLAKLVSLPSSILTASLLGPFLFGTWRALGLIRTYAPFLQLGIFSGLFREIPYAKGQGETAKMVAYKEIGFAASLLAALSAAAIIFLASYILVGRYSPLMITGIRVMAVVVFFNHIRSFYGYVLRAEQNFVFLSHIKIFFSFASSVLQVIGVLIYGINGVFAAAILANIGIVLYLYGKVPIPLRIPRLKVIRLLMKSGIPMLLNGMAHTLLFTTDRLLIVALLGRIELGYYAIALLAATLVDFVPSTVRSVLLPRIMWQVGTSNSNKELERFWLEPLYVMAYLMPIFVGLVWLFAPVGIFLFLPEYLPGILALKILSYSIFFASVTTLTRNFFIAINKQYRVLAAFMIALALGFSLNFTFIKLGWGITGVALATLLSFLFLGILLLHMALSLQGRTKDLPLVMARVYGPSLAVAVILICLEIILPAVETLQKELINTAIKLGSYFVLLLPVLYFFNRETHLISQLILQMRRKTTWSLFHSQGKE